ncbi:MAG: HEAT repeat domain-containing protein, partial [Candidatus Heimdallarchaeota archaeon]
MNAAQILGWIGEKSKPAVPALIEALEDKCINVRIYSAYALGSIGKNAELAVPALIVALKHDYLDLCCTAAWALAEMGEKAEPAVPSLIKALKGKEGLRREAARALAEIGEKAEPAVQALIEALNDKSGGVQYEAARAISRFGEEVKKSAILELKILITKEQDNNNKFKLTESLIQIEGKEGEGTKIIEDLKEKGKLSKWQIKRFNYICQKLRIEEQFEEVQKGLQSAQETTKSMRKSVEEQPEIPGKELMEPIKRIEATITPLPKTIIELTQLIKEILQVKRINFPRPIIKKKLNELVNEDEFQELLMTILPDLGFENCELSHGVLESGKDIVGIT